MLITNIYFFIMGKIFAVLILLMGQTSLFSQNYLADSIIWSEDFDSSRWQQTVTPFDFILLEGNNLISPELLPDGWTVIDHTGNEYYWHWSKMGPRGKLSGGIFNYSIFPVLDFHPYYCLEPSNSPYTNLRSETAANGYMLIEPDYYNTVYINNLCSPKQPLSVLNSAIISPAIPVSGNDILMVRFQEYFRYCCLENTGIELLVSADYNPALPENAHWVSFSATGGTSMNDYPLINPLVIETDITSLVQGVDTIHLMWKIEGLTHYCWAFDDVEIFRPVMNNISTTISSVQMGYQADDVPLKGKYTQFPIVAAPDRFKMKRIIQNNGYNYQTGVLFKTEMILNDITVSQDESSGNLNYYPLETDTVDNLMLYSPPVPGNYVIKATMTGDSASSWQSDNTFMDYLSISDSIYSRISPNETFTDSIASPAISTDSWAVLFEIPANRDIVPLAVSFYIQNCVPLTAIENNYIRVTGKIFKAGEDGSPGELIATSESYYPVVSDIKTWVVLPFSNLNPESFNSRYYFACIEFYYQMNPAGLYIGNDATSDKYYKVVYRSHNNEWWDVNVSPYSHYNPAIRLHFSKPALSNYARTINAARIFPNPSKGTVMIENAGNATIYLFNLSTVCVYHTKITSNSQLIDLSWISDGCYFMKITSGRSEITKKIILLKNH